MPFSKSISDVDKYDKQREYHHSLEKQLRRQVEQTQSRILQDHQDQVQLNEFINKKLNEIKI